MSPLLREFLKDWIEWVDAGAIEGGPFSRCYGLCLSFEEQLQARGIERNDVASEGEQLLRIFLIDGLNPVYPFGGEEVFGRGIAKHEQHMNADRIAWVRSKVAQKQEA